MAINTETCIFEPSLLSRSMGSGNKPFHLDCGIDLSRCGIAIVASGRIMVAPVV